MNLTGVQAVRPLLLTPANYSQVQQTLLKLHLPSQAAQKQQQPDPEPASVESKTGKLNFTHVVYRFILACKE